MSSANRIVRIGEKLYDIRTTNISFLDAVLLAREMGIPNYYAPLEIVDTSLCDIDLTKVNPETGEPTLTAEEKVRVINECKKNPWYYFREVLRLNIPEENRISFVASLFTRLKNLD